VRGILTGGARPPASRDDQSVAVMDLAVAMRELGRHNRLDRILIQVPETRELAEWTKLLR